MKKVFFISVILLSQLLFAQNNRNAIRIAVLDFGTSGGLSDMEAVTLTNRLRSMLVKTNAFVVLERGKMDEILTEQGFQQTGCTTTECAIEVGKMLNVQKMVSGTIGKLGRTWTMDISLIDIETSQIEKSFFQDYKGEIDGLLTEMESVAVEIADITGKKDEVQSLKNKTFNLSILSKPSEANIYINGKFAGKTPFERKAKEGLQLEIKLEKKNYITWKKNISVTKNININADMEFTEAYKQKLARQAKDNQSISGESSGNTWWWIGGGILVAGGAAAAILLSSGNDGVNQPEAEFPKPPGRP